MKKNIIKLILSIACSLALVLCFGSKLAMSESAESGSCYTDPKCQKTSQQIVTDTDQTPDPNTIDVPRLKLGIDLGYSDPKVSPGGMIGYNLTQATNTPYKTNASAGKNMINGVEITPTTNLYNYRIYVSRKLTAEEEKMDITRAEQSMSANAGNFNLVAGGTLKEGEQVDTNYGLPSSRGAGSYHFRIIVDDNITHCVHFQNYIVRFTIAETNGVLLEVPDKVIQGTKPTIKIKFYGLQQGGNKYAIYVDGQQKEVLLQDKSITTDGQIVYYDQWDTSGTSLGDHTVMVKVFPGTTADNNKTEKTIKVISEAEAVGNNGSGSGSGSDASFWSKFTENLSRNLSYFLGFQAGSDQGASASLSTVNESIKKVIQYALDAAGVVALIMILYASIIYLTAYGEESKAELAKKTLVWSVIGLIVIIFSQAIILIIYNQILK